MGFAITVKKILPNRFLFWLKNWKQFSRHDKPEGFCEGKKIIFFDSADYGNVGDLAIAVGIRRYAEREFPEYKFIEISQSGMASYINYVKEHIGEEDIIFLTGGGNMGNLYPMFEENRRRIIREFPNTKTIVFPQTMYYTPDLPGKVSLKIAQKTYAGHSDLTLYARDERSYKAMKTAFPGADVIIHDDMALSLGKQKFELPRSGCGTCLRGDVESILDETSRNEIRSAVAKSFPENAADPQFISEFSTVTDAYFKTWSTRGSGIRERIVRGKLEQVASYRLVVTDRLHAAIFAYLTETPCILLNSRSDKNAGIYKRLSDADYIQFATDVNEAIEMIEAFAQKG